MRIDRKPNLPTSPISGAGHRPDIVGPPAPNTSADTNPAGADAAMVNKASGMKQASRINKATRFSKETTVISQPVRKWFGRGSALVLALTLAVLLATNVAGSQGSAPDDPRQSRAPSVSAINRVLSSQRSIEVTMEVGEDGTTRIVGTKVVVGPAARTIGGDGEFLIDLLDARGQEVQQIMRHDPREVHVDGVGDRHETRVVDTGTFTVAVPFNSRVATVAVRDLARAEPAGPNRRQPVAPELVRFDLRPTKASFCARNSRSGACSGVSRTAKTAVERHCTAYDPKQLRVVSANGGFQVRAGDVDLDVLPTRQDAAIMVAVAGRHTRQCFIGKAAKNAEATGHFVEFWQGNSGQSVKLPANRACVRYDSSRVTTRRVSTSRHEVRSGSVLLATLPTAADANRTKALAEGHNQHCVVGDKTTKRPAARFRGEYWLRNNVSVRVPLPTEVKSRTPVTVPTVNPPVRTPTVNTPVRTPVRTPVVTVPVRTPIRTPVVTVPVRTPVRTPAVNTPVRTPLRTPVVTAPTSRQPGVITRR